MISGIFIEAFIMVNTSSFARGHDKTGDVFKVIEKFRKIRNIDFADSLIGPDDILCHISADSPGALLDTLHNDIRVLKMDRHNYIENTETFPVFGSWGTPLKKMPEHTWKMTRAWVLSKMHVGDPTTLRRLIGIDPRIKSVSTVLGRFDAIICLEANSMTDLMRVIDGTIRTKNFLDSTDTRIVLM